MWNMHKRATLLLHHKHPQLFTLRNLLNPDAFHIAIALETSAKIYESTKCHCGKIFDELGHNGFSCTKNVGCFPRHLATNSILKRSLTCINLSSTLEPVGLTNGGRPDGLTLVPRYRGLSLSSMGCNSCGHFFLLGAITKTLPDRLVLWLRKLRMQNAKNTMTSKAITIFNQWQMRPLVCMASLLPLFWVTLQTNLFIYLVTPWSATASGSTNACLWLWSGETLPAYWPVCKFDLTLSVLFLVAFNILTSIAACHLPLCQCIAGRVLYGMG